MTGMVYSQMGHWGIFIEMLALFVVLTIISICVNNCNEPFVKNKEIETGCNEARVC